MKLIRDHVRETFRKYTDAYDSSDPKINLKIIHTYHVAEDADEIARSLRLSDSDTDLAWLLGMLHDLGRFEQIRRYGTFNDARSMSHAHLSCEVLFPDFYNVDQKFFDEMPNGRFGQITDFIEEGTEEDYDLIRTAIWNHSEYRIPDDLDERHTMFSNIIRDADKVDIFRVNVEESIEDIYNVSENQLKDACVSDQAVDAIRKHICVERRADYKPTSVDHVISHCCLAFELVYPMSCEITKRQGYLQKLVSFQSNNQKTQSAMELLKKELYNVFEKN